MKKKSIMMLAGVAALGAYGYIEGKGPFNKIKFKEQHDAVSRYIEAHYPGALYAPISETADGWVTAVRRFGMPPIMLYITRSNDGTFIFNETTPDFS